MKLYMSMHQEQPATRDAALHEEFASIATSQSVSAMRVQDWYLTDDDVKRVIDESLALRQIQ